MIHILKKIFTLLYFTLVSLALIGCNADTDTEKTNKIPTQHTQHKVTTIQDKLPKNKMGPELVVVPAGTNILGDATGIGLERERPTYQVTIKKPFAIGKYEITFDDYDLFCEDVGREKPDDEGWGRGKRPVINITWDDALSYVKWLSIKTGEQYYLPSEAQWEYASRAGTQTNYWWGDEPGDNMAQCATCAAIHRCEDCKDVPLKDEGTLKVGSFKPNPFGLFDSHGNVMEWTADCGNKTNSSKPSNGTPRLTGDCTRHIMKDGSWWYKVRFIRPSFRSFAAEGWDYRGKHVGFRVARVINEKEKSGN